MKFVRFDEIQRQIHHQPEAPFRTNNRFHFLLFNLSGHHHIVFSTFALLLLNHLRVYFFTQNKNGRIFQEAQIVKRIRTKLLLTFIIFGWWAVRLNRFKNMNEPLIEITSMFLFQLCFRFQSYRRICFCVQKGKVKTYCPLGCWKREKERKKEREIEINTTQHYHEACILNFIFWCFCGLLAYTSNIFYGILHTLQNTKPTERANVSVKFVRITECPIATSIYTQKIYRMNSNIHIPTQTDHNDDQLCTACRIDTFCAVP